MSKAEAMTADKVCIETLSLRIAGLNAPFTLSGLERDFGPEEWAWQFLRLNTGYQREYAQALANRDPDETCPSGALDCRHMHPERKILASELLCRRQFGLSTWLDPNAMQLPVLKDGESWFYPLTKSVDSPEEPSLRLPLEGVFKVDPRNGECQASCRLRV